MQIRHTTMQDLDRVMEIYAHARDFMAAHGNPYQWGPTSWPPVDLIRSDIRTGRGYVCVDENDQPIGSFFYDHGPDIEPTYRVIEDGSWRDSEGAISPGASGVPCTAACALPSYGVVHRIASDGSRPGIGTFCINWAYDQCGHLKMDTHGDNLVMQNLLEKLGFERRGIIHVEEDHYPRIAYEK